jgi:hypothetical protein
VPCNHRHSPSLSRRSFLLAFAYILLFLSLSRLQPLLHHVWTSSHKLFQVRAEDRQYRVISTYHGTTIYFTHPLASPTVATSVHLYSRRLASLRLPTTRSPITRQLHANYSPTCPTTRNNSMARLVGQPSLHSSLRTRPPPATPARLLPASPHGLRPSLRRLSRRLQAPRTTSTLAP